MRAFRFSRDLSISHFSKRGFALAEVIVALFFVTMAVVLVGGLGQQVMNLAKRSTQTGSILELRSMMNSITRNVDPWLSKMRSSVATQGVYAGCIPDPTVNISTFTCPSVAASLLSADPELARIAGTVFHVASSPIVDSMGEKIAGTLEAPVYLDIQGRPCQSSAVDQCALRSTGYFLRSNAASDQDPGSVKFVLKIERNSLNATAGTTPMKPQYMSVDVGTDWKDLSPALAQMCPANTIKVGYLSNGNPRCVNPAKPCADSSQFPIGTDTSGNTLCRSLPDCSSTGGFAVVDSSGGNLVCSTQSPCGENKLFLGYFAGTGQPMCSSSSIKCASGQVQVGIAIANGNMTAECETPPACTDVNKRLSFNGEKFVCESVSVAASCGDDEVMSGIKADGTPSCVSRNPASDDQSCTVGQEMYGIDSAGKIKCRPAGGSTDFTLVAPLDLKQFGNGGAPLGEGQWQNVDIPSAIPSTAKAVLIGIHCICSMTSVKSYLDPASAPVAGYVDSQYGQDYSRHVRCSSGSVTGSYPTGSNVEVWVPIDSTRRFQVGNATTCSHRVSSNISIRGWK